VFLYLLKFIFAGIEEVHAIKGKTLCIQLTTVMIGFQGIIFNALAQFGVFPCAPPLNFTSRRKGMFAKLNVGFNLFLINLLNNKVRQGF